MTHTRTKSKKIFFFSFQNSRCVHTHTWCFHSCNFVLPLFFVSKVKFSDLIITVLTLCFFCRVTSSSSVAAAAAAEWKKKKIFIIQSKFKYHYYEWLCAMIIIIIFFFFFLSWLKFIFPLFVCVCVWDKFLKNLFIFDENLIHLPFGYCMCTLFICLESLRTYHTFIRLIFLVLFCFVFFHDFHHHQHHRD